jgi:glucose-6-phosphate isomerase
LRDPRLAVEALREFDVGKVRCHFLPNVDGHRTAELMRRLDPKRTLVLLVSKSFTTQETLLNGRVLRDWLAAAYGGDTAGADRHLIAISANVDAARAFGIPAARVLPMWDFVGGRYSVWSAVGFVLALSIGMHGFHAFLRGAASMDDHFRTAPWRDNLPVLLALLGVWNRNALGLPSSAVIPYHDDLRELPSFLQQLEMESLGKSVTTDGKPVAQATVPVIWGNVGTNAQHAFFQHCIRARTSSRWTSSARSDPRTRCAPITTRCSRTCSRKAPRSRSARHTKKRSQKPRVATPPSVMRSPRSARFPATARVRRCCSTR